MPIENRAPEATLVGQLAIKAGQAEAAQRAQAQAAESAAVLQRLQAEREAQQLRMQENQEVAKREAERRVQDRTFVEDLQQKATETAHVWELQKMQISSQNDFMMKEKERQLTTEYEIQKELAKKAKYDRAIEELYGEKGRKMYSSGAEQDRAAAQLWEDFYGFKGPASTKPTKDTTRQQQEAMVKFLSGYSGSGKKVQRLNAKGEEIGAASPQEITQIEIEQQALAQLQRGAAQSLTNIAAQVVTATNPTTGERVRQRPDGSWETF